MASNPSALGGLTVHAPGHPSMRHASANGHPRPQPRWRCAFTIHCYSHRLAPQVLIISQLTECEMPIDQIRAGGTTALKALESLEFFKLPGGAWHDEILLVGELLRRERNLTVVTDGARKAGERVVKLLEDVRARVITREGWELRVKQFLVEGQARRAHLLSLVSIEVLRGVGFTAKELHDGGLTLVQLKAGAFTVGELKAAIGVEVRTLKELGYTPYEMRTGSVSAGELKPFGYTAKEMRAVCRLCPNLRSRQPSIGRTCTCPSTWTCACLWIYTCMS